MGEASRPRPPFSLLREAEEAEEVLILTYTASLEFFERFGLSQARALQARTTIVADARMTRPDPGVVRWAGTRYLDGRAVAGESAFHPKLVVVAGQDEIALAIGSGNMTASGWSGAAEIWTVLRGDGQGAPSTMGEAATFLRALPRSRVRLSPGIDAALERVAALLERPAMTGEGPRLLSSLDRPIIEQLPTGPVSDLIVYAPFHDTDLAGLTRIVERLRPENLTVYVQRETEVDGPALEAFVSDRGGRIAWVAGDAYHHGKLIEWTSGDDRYALTGSPNLSRRALLQRAGAGGNCELALLARVSGTLAPAEGQPPAKGLALLEAPRRDPDKVPSVSLLAATLGKVGAITITLAGDLAQPARLQMYLRDQDQWVTVPGLDLPVGQRTYEVAGGGLHAGDAVRLFLESDQITSNEVFIADLERLARRPLKHVGQALRTPAEILRGDGLDLLIADIDQLHPYLKRTGVLASAGTTGHGDDEEGDAEQRHETRGPSLEEYVAACGAVLGESLVEWALVLPRLGEDPFGRSRPADAIAAEHEEGEVDEFAAEDPPPQDVLRDLTENQRGRVRRFCEQLGGRFETQRRDGTPRDRMIVRTLAAQLVLHGIAADLWADDADWAALLGELAASLGDDSDLSLPGERAAATAVGAMMLAVLRTRVHRLSVRDERTLGFRHAGEALRGLLDQIDQRKLEQLSLDLEPAFGYAVDPQRVHEVLADLAGAEDGIARAVRLLNEEYGIVAETSDGAIIFHAELPPVPDYRLVLALSLVGEDTDLVVARGRTPKGQVQAIWQAPWLVIDHKSIHGHRGELYRLGGGLDLRGLVDSSKSGDIRQVLPGRASGWMPGQPATGIAAALLARAAERCR